MPLRRAFKFLLYQNETLETTIFNFVIGIMIYHIFVSVKHALIAFGEISKSQLSALWKILLLDAGINCYTAN